MKKAAPLAIFLLILMSASPGFATILTFDYNVEFSGGTPPTGTAPWLRATFDDFGGSGTVLLTLSAIGLTADESVTEWYFNFDPTLNAALFLPSAVNTNDADWNSISAGNDAFKADGDGKYDFLFDFAPPGADRFQSGDVVTFQFTGASITADSFKYLSAPDGGNGPFKAAAHVQSIAPDDGSGWVAPDDGGGGGGNSEVPEPMSLILLGSGLAGAGLYRRLRKPRG